MTTSCCPAWVKYLELNDPKYLHNISSCKSPMEMFAAVLRDKYQAKDAADGRRTYHMAIMPCTAKKMEAARAEFPGRLWQPVRGSGHHHPGAGGHDPGGRYSADGAGA